MVKKTALLLSILILGCNACQVLAPAPRLTPLPLPTAAASPHPVTLSTQAAIGATPTSPPTATPFPLASATPTATPPEVLVRLVNPLTGLEVSDPRLLTQRPILVKLANWPESLRPFVGINGADMVFEYYIGHQMNHLAALYYGRDEAPVGPLAPARDFDLKLMETYQSNLVIASAPDALDHVLRRDIWPRTAIRGDLPYPAFYTEPQAMGGNTVVDTAAVRAGLNERYSYRFVPGLEGMVFDLTPPKGGQTAIELCYTYADFSVMQWHFDALSTRYELWQDLKKADGKYTVVPSRDREGDPVAFDNLVVLFGKYVEYSDKDYDFELPQASPQQALVLRDGQLYYARWQVPGPLSPIVLTDQNGQPLALKPGRTWMVFSSINTRTERDSEGVWDLYFSVK